VADHRAKKKAKTLPKPKPEPGVTSDVTATPEAGAESRKAEYAQAERERYTKSAEALAQFRYACDTWLPKMKAAFRVSALEYARSVREQLDAADAATTQEAAA
jgi:hypothetical protein